MMIDGWSSSRVPMKSHYSICYKKIFLCLFCFFMAEISSIYHCLFYILHFLLLAYLNIFADFTFARNTFIYG
jgi:hypothetical protein